MQPVLSLRLQVGQTATCANKTHTWPAAVLQHEHTSTTPNRLLVPRTTGVHPFYSSFFVRWNLWTGPFCVATLAFTPFFGSQVRVLGLF